MTIDETPTRTLQPTDSAGYTLTDGDLHFLGITESSKHNCLAKLYPLGMNAIQYQDFTKGLLVALNKESISDADVRLQGSSVTFFSSELKTFPRSREDYVEYYMSEFGELCAESVLNAIENTIEQQWPTTRPHQRPFDSMYTVGLSPERSDIDVQVSSDHAFRLISQRVSSLRVDQAKLRVRDSRYNFMRKEFSEREFLHLSQWTSEWESQLDRAVNLVFFDGHGPPNTGLSVSSHFKESDWRIAGFWE